MVSGLPDTVQENLEDVLNLDTQTEPDWRRTVGHSLNKYRRQEKDETDEDKALARQLLKAQLAEKRHDVNSKKKGQPCKQMAAISELHSEIAEAVAQAMKTERANQPPVAPRGDRVPLRSDQEEEGTAVVSIEVR